MPVNSIVTLANKIVNGSGRVNFPAMQMRDLALLFRCINDAKLERVTA